MTDTIRKQILDYMLVAIATTAAPSFPITISTVALGPLTSQDNRKRYSVGVVTRPERYNQVIPLYERHLPIALEYRVTANKDDPSPGELLELMLGGLEQIVLANLTWGGLAIDTKLLRNENDLTSYADRSVQGVLFIEVFYRHAHNDPTSPFPAF